MTIDDLACLICPMVHKGCDKRILTNVPSSECAKALRRAGKIIKNIKGMENRPYELKEGGYYDCV